MPQGTKHQSKKTTKILNLGDAGSGKTGALHCLVRAGYRLIVVDFDNGLDILINLIRDDKTMTKAERIECLNRIYYETFTDKLKMVNGMVIPTGTPSAFTDAMGGLTNWKFPVEAGSKEMYDLGNSGSWGQDTVIVVDSLGLAGQAALRLVRQVNQHQMDKFVSQPDYGQAMNKIETMLQMLYSDSIECHVIVNTHITYIEDRMTEALKGLPRALGSKLPPNVGGYFNSVIHTVSVGAGKSTKRVIRTTSEVGLELKVPVAPGILSEQLPIESGLLTIFQTLQKADWLEEDE